MNRQQAREEAFKFLFQHELNAQLIEEQTFSDAFLKRLIHGVIEKKSQIEAEIKQHLKKWTLDRIAIVDKTILVIATYEILFENDIPTAVSINEAVELAKKYGDENASKFINGVLSNIKKEG